jgi:ABC-type multidrug transport system ATPase subunit
MTNLEVLSMAVGRSAGSPAVEVHELRKEFRRRDRKAGRFARRRVPALDGVTFTIARGECVAVLGQNGSGKSTLVRLLSTLLLGDGGTACVFGYDVFAEPKRVQRLIARVSVEASFFKKCAPFRPHNLQAAVRRSV